MTNEKTDQSLDELLDFGEHINFGINYFMSLGGPHYGLKAKLEVIKYTAGKEGVNLEADERYKAVCAAGKHAFTEQLEEIDRFRQHGAVESEPEFPEYAGSYYSHFNENLDYHLSALEVIAETFRFEMPFTRETIAEECIQKSLANYALVMQKFKPEPCNYNRKSDVKQFTAELAILGKLPEEKIQNYLSQIDNMQFD